MYRLKHKKTGLYWQPLVRKNDNLSESGKAFSCINNANIALETGKVLRGISVQKSSPVYKATRDVINYRFIDIHSLLGETIMSDWEVEKV